MASESVAIVGAGISGLALAQSLVAHGVDCRVVEREREFPGRSVRIHCRPALAESLRASLPGDVFAAFCATQGRPDARHVYLDPDLDVVAVDERPEAEIVLDTATAREVLALGLGPRLELGREAIAVERTRNGRLRLVFSDGSAA